MVEEKKPESPKAAKVRKESPVRITPKFEVQTGANHTFLWKLINDGKVLVTSKVFTVKADAFTAIRNVKESVRERNAIEIKAEDGKHYFRVRTTSRQVLATSEQFAKKEDCEVAILAARKAPQAVVIDRTV